MEKFGDITKLRILVNPNISKRLFEWLDREVTVDTYDGYAHNEPAIIWIYEYYVKDIIEAYENTHESMRFKELDSFVKFLQNNKVDYVKFPNGYIEYEKN